MKTTLFTMLIASVSLLSACSGNYFSNHRTVYRIETTTGQRYYSDSQPSERGEKYAFDDLDGNRYELDKARISNVTKFKHKK